MAFRTATRVGAGPVMALRAPAGAEQLAKGGLIVFGGRGGVDETLDDVDEAGRVIVKRKVAGAFEDLEAGAGHRSMRHRRMMDGDDHIFRAPDDLHRDGLGQITSVEHGDDLPAPIHHRPQRPAECR